MRHARNDYNGRIVDNAGIIPENEPVFLLRAQDVCAPQTVRFYAMLAEAAGAAPALVEATARQASEMEAWQAYQRRKVPDLVLPLGEPGSTDDLLVNAPIPNTL